MAINNFNQFKSYYLIGLRSFKYRAVDDPGNQGFSWTADFYSGPTFEIVVDNQFDQINYNVFLINFIYCDNPGFPLRGFNSTTGLEECFDECYLNYFVDY